MRISLEPGFRHEIVMGAVAPPMRCPHESAQTRQRLGAILFLTIRQLRLQLVAELEHFAFRGRCIARPSH
jgi:hypothetical protein